MSNNAQHEAVFPPAVHNLRTMAQLSPTRSGAKGSYELYDPQQKSLVSPELKRINTAGGTAPGSPGSLQDYNQVVQKLQRELEDSKRKESELQQMLSEIKNPLIHLSPNFLENIYLEASPSNESIGENVKDAHIRHLQRQVTVLQASLFKSEGWVNRVAAAVKERNKALDDVARLTNELRDMQESNSHLSRKIEMLNSALQEAHANLQIATEQLNNQNYSGQFVSQLKDEIQRQKNEIKTLKEAVSRLELENKSLKEPSLNSGGQSFGNMACSQELEHLHKVVDRLKSTVLQQRSYLLQLRQPVNGSNTKSPSVSSAFVNSDGLLNRDHDSTTGRNSSSPKLRMAGTNLLNIDATLETLAQKNMYGHAGPAMMTRSGTPKENIVDIHSQQRSGSDLFHSGTAAARRKLNSREMLDDTFNIDVLNLPNPLTAMQAGTFTGMESRHNPQVFNKNVPFYTPANQNSRSYLCHDIGDLTKQNIGLPTANGCDPAKFTQHKPVQRKQSQSETVGLRNGIEGMSQDKPAGQSDWPGRQWNLTSANNSAALETNNDYIDSFNKVDPGLTHNQRYQSEAGAEQEAVGRTYETVPAETQGQFVLNGNIAQVMLDNSMMTQFGNLNLNSAKATPQQIHQLHTDYHDVPARMTGHDMVNGQKSIPPPPTHLSAPQAVISTHQDVVYVNAAVGQGLNTFSTATSTNPSPSGARSNSDRLCPVCNNDYSHVSMEDFQTHVFECFDDENSPETMKPNADRSCPMCNISISSTITQAEYEKHVHSHFGEDGPLENFEILQP